MNIRHLPLFILMTSFSVVADDENIYDLSLEDLANIDVVSASSLTNISRRLQPANITFISSNDIKLAGASNQIDLMNILVPELQVVSTKGTGHNPAFRGIPPAAPVAHTYLINGRSLNMNFFLGSLVESYNLMGDLETIEIIHGPGSVIHGPGALTGVISARTYDATTFQGIELTAKHMFENKSNIAEMKFGHKTGENAGLFIYAGFEDQDGADTHDAPIRYSNSFTAINGQEIIAGKDANINASNYQASPDNDYKFYIDYTDNNLKAWYRYSHESERMYIDRTKLSTAAPDNVNLIDGVSAEFLIEHSNSYIYDHHSIQLAYDWQFNDDLSVKTTMGADQVEGDFDFPYPDGRKRFIEHNEDEINGQIIANWTIDDKNQLAFGVEAFNHGYSFKVNHQDSRTGPWDVFSYAALFEFQSHLSEKWTTFIGGRVDKGRYSDHLFSPRLAIIYSASEKDTVKFIANEAVRFPPELVARLDAKKGQDKIEEESLTSFELSYDRKHTKEFSLHARTYYQKLDAIDSLAGLQANVGEFETLGITLSASYQDNNTEFNFSHSFTELLDATDRPGINPSNLSASGQGYGDDINAWSSNNTKLNIIYSPMHDWSFNSAINIAWDYKGSQDLGEYNSFERLGGAKASSIVIDPDYDEAFQTNIELSAGAEYRPNDNTRLRLDVYNIVSAIDDEYSRYQDRNYGTYRVKPFSVMLSVNYTL